jgi:Fe-S-cluster containining protein
MSTAEALRLLDFLSEHRTEQHTAQIRSSWEQRIIRLRQTAGSGVSEDVAIESLLGLGACVFLDGDICGVYPARPDTCRSVYVWHTADQCTRPEFDMCTPAELKELRVRRLYESMQAELKGGRLPFWGHLLVMVWLLDRFRNEYEEGRDLSELVDPIWSETGLIRFVEPGRGPERVKSLLDAEQAEFVRIFAEEPWPLGQPRAADVSDRSQLSAFPIDVKWLEDHARLEELDS